MKIAAYVSFDANSLRNERLRGLNGEAFCVLALSVAYIIMLIWYVGQWSGRTIIPNLMNNLLEFDWF